MFLRRASSWSMIPAEVVCEKSLGLDGDENEEDATHHDDDTKGTSGEQQVDPRLDLGGLDVEAGGDDTGLVETAVQLDDDLARAVVIDDLEFTNVAWAKISTVDFMTEEFMKKGGCRLRRELQSVRVKAN